MRIGLVSDHYPPLAPGGAEWSIAALAEALEPRLERVVVAVAAAGSAGAEERGALRVERFREPISAFARGGAARPWALANPAFTAVTALRLARLGRAERLDLLHAQSHAALPAAFLAARWLGVPVVATLRDTRTLCEAAVCLHSLPRVPAGCGWAKLMRECSGEFFARAGAPRGALRRLRARSELSWLWADNRARWACLRRCDAVVALSRATLDTYRGRGLLDERRSRLAVIPSLPPAPPPDSGERRAAVRRRLGCGDAPLLVYLGKHSAGKGTALLRRAWAGLAPRFPAARLILAGPGHPPPDSPGLSVVGAVEHSEALDLILASDLVISPSVAPEALPRSLVEAAGLGRPVLGTRAGGTPELVRDGVNGLLVERGSATALEEGLERFLRDPGLAARLADGQRAQRAAPLDPGAASDAHVDLYRDLVDARRGEGREAAVRAAGAAP